MDINNIATKKDIDSLKEDLEIIKKLLDNQPRQKEILRSSEVKKILNISDSTLQRYRISGELPAQQINGTWFYKYSDIAKRLEGEKK